MPLDVTELNSLPLDLKQRLQPYLDVAPWKKLEVVRQFLIWGAAVGLSVFALGPLGFGVREMVHDVANNGTTLSSGTEATLDETLPYAVSLPPILLAVFTAKTLLNWLTRDPGAVGRGIKRAPGMTSACVAAGVVSAYQVVENTPQSSSIYALLATAYGSSLLTNAGLTMFILQPNLLSDHLRLMLRWLCLEAAKLGSEELNSEISRIRHEYNDLSGEPEKLIFALRALIKLAGEQRYRVPRFTALSHFLAFLSLGAVFLPWGASMRAIPGFRTWWKDPAKFDGDKIDINKHLLEGIVGLVLFGIASMVVNGKLNFYGVYATILDFKSPLQKFNAKVAFVSFLAAVFFVLNYAYVMAQNIKNPALSFVLPAGLSLILQLILGSLGPSFLYAASSYTGIHRVVSLVGTAVTKLRACVSGSSAEHEHLLGERQANINFLKNTITQVKALSAEAVEESLGHMHELFEEAERGAAAQVDDDIEAKDAADASQGQRMQSVAGEGLRAAPHEPIKNFAQFFPVSQDDSTRPKYDDEDRPRRKSCCQSFCERFARLFTY